jgi:hypothetical protein
MTFEEMQKTMQFILEQQAQFASDIQQLREAQAASERAQAAIQVKLDKIADATIAAFGIIGELTASQKQLAESHKQLAEAQARSEQRHAETEERLNALISLVERYISGRNGKSES